MDTTYIHPYHFHKEWGTKYTHMLTHTLKQGIPHAQQQQSEAGAIKESKTSPHTLGRLYSKKL